MTTNTNTTTDATTTVDVSCPDCGHAAYRGKCLNVDCTRAAVQATPRDLSAPAAVTISGQID